jgi:hypothetical protein
MLCHANQSIRNSPQHSPLLRATTVSQSRLLLSSHGFEQHPH